MQHKRITRQRTRGCVVVIAGLIIGALLCAGLLIGGLIGLRRLTESLPTPPPRPTLTDGNDYWLEGIELGPIRSYWTDLLSLPSHGADSTIVAVVSDSSRVRLVRRQADWCYVEVIDEYFRDPLLTNDRIEEGWVECSRLLGYQPTPLPTPILTPQRPLD